MTHYLRFQKFESVHYEHASGLSLPVGFSLIAKTEFYVDKKDGKQKRRSPKTKNEHYQALLRQAVHNQIPFQYVMNDVWYACADNLKFIKNNFQKDFIMPLKSNRKVALSLADKQEGLSCQWTRWNSNCTPPWKSTLKAWTSRSCWSSTSS